MSHSSSSDAQRRSFDLTTDHAHYVDRLVADGAFATDSEVVNAGLQALRDREDQIERWLCDEVVPTYDRMQADPSRGLSADEVRRRLQSAHEERLSAERQCKKR